MEGAFLQYYERLVEARAASSCQGELDSDEGRYGVN